MSQPQRIASYREFWPFYLREHADPRTRGWHIAGTGAASVLLIAAILALRYELLIAALIAGYGPAWIAHFVIEKNRPAMVSHPAWAFQCDISMFRLWLTGQLGAELARAGVA